MTTITFGRLLDGSAAEIRLSDAEHRAFERADSYSAKLLIARRAAFRVRLISLLLTADGILETNLNCREPGPDETLVWLKSGQFGEMLDRNPTITLGPKAVKLLGSRGSHAEPTAPDADLLAWLDAQTGTTIKELAAVLEVSRAEVQKRVTAMAAIGLVRRSGPASRHTPVRWYLAEAEGEAA